MNMSTETTEAFTTILAAQPKRQRLSLRDLTDEMLALDALAAMDLGEWTEEHEALGDELATKLAAKTDDFWEYRLTLKADAERATAYAKEVREKADRLLKRVEWLDRYLLVELERNGRGFVKGDVWEVRRQANPVSVVVEVLPTALPAEYQRTIPAVVEADKKALSAALKAGTVIEGVRLAEPTYHLRAK